MLSIQSCLIMLALVSVAHAVPCVNVTETCRPDTLLYLGADVDTQMLEQLQPWELNAVYSDAMIGRVDRAENARINNVAEDFARHHADDERRAYRLTSNAFRPCPYLSCAAPLTALVQARLEASRVFEGVHVPRNLSFRFEMGGRARRLDYMVADFQVFVESKFMQHHVAHRVSTVGLLGSAQMGAPKDMRRLLHLIVPKCLRAVRVIASPHDREFISRIRPILHEEDVAYAVGDTLAGRRLHGEQSHGAVTAFCLSMRDE